MKNKKDDDVVFVTQVPQHPRNRLKQKIQKYSTIENGKKQIVTSKAKAAKTVKNNSRKNSEILKKGSFNFSHIKYQTKTLFLT